MKESIEIDMVKNLLSETHSFVCVLEGENHKVKYANKTFRDQSSIGSMIDQPVTKMFHEESSYQHIVNKLDEVYKCGTDYKESEVPIHDEKGNLCFINIFQELLLSIKQKRSETSIKDILSDDISSTIIKCLLNQLDATKKEGDEFLIAFPVDGQTDILCCC